MFVDILVIDDKTRPKTSCSLVTERGPVGRKKIFEIGCRNESPGLWDTVEEYKHLGCQSDKTRCSQDSTWGPLDCEAKTLPLDQQVKHIKLIKLNVIN